MPSGRTGTIEHWRNGIVARGVLRADNAELDTLAAVFAAENRWEFQLVIAPLVIEGATGSPVNPIAVL
jgi:hypothetical protein